MKKKLGSLVLAMALMGAMAAPAAAAELPVAQPDARTSIVWSRYVLEDQEVDGFSLSMDYVFVIDQQGILWQYQSGEHRVDLPITGSFQQTQLTTNVVQIQEAIPTACASCAPTAPWPFCTFPRPGSTRWPPACPPWRGSGM